MYKKLIAEFIGTFTLVFLGVGAAVLAADVIGNAGVAFSFGLALLGMAYGIGTISGCHINPAVSIGAYTAGRVDIRDLVGYIVAQALGAIVAAAVVLVIAEGGPGGYDVAVDGLGQNGWGEALGGYSLGAAIAFELVATFLFVVVILGSTQAKAPVAFAGLAIGLALVAIHLVGIPITGVSVNPARSLGPALFVGGEALRQLWMFLVIPTAGGLIAGILFRAGSLEAD